MSKVIGEIQEPEPLAEIGETEHSETLQKPKRKMSEKQLETLKKGQEKLKLKRQQQREDRDKREGELKAELEQKKNDMIVKQADKIKKTKAVKEKKMKAVIGEVDSETDVEEHVVKKPKKKRIVYREESDSEEEVIVRRKPKQEPQRPLPPPVSQQPAKFRINFC